MSLSFLFENPGTALLTILAFVAGILLFPIAAAVKRSRNARDRQAQRASEPRIQPDLYSASRHERYDERSRADPYERPDRGYAGYGADDAYQRFDRGFAGYDADDDGYPRPDQGYTGTDEPYQVPDRGYQARLADDAVDYHGYRSRADDPPDDRSRRVSDRWTKREEPSEGSVRPIFGSGGASQMRKSARPAGPARGLWFVFGVTVGIAATMLWTSVPTADTLTTLLAFFENSNAPAIADEPAAETDGKVQERMASVGETDSAAPTADDQGNDVGQLINAFVASLKTQLPMAVGPGITMAAVEADSKTIALGFTIAQAITEEDEPKLQSELETRFRTSVCATEPDPTNIHGLNRRGVSFLISYTDLLGRNVAGLTVGPNYCASPA